MADFDLEKAFNDLMAGKSPASVAGAGTGAHAFASFWAMIAGTMIDMGLAPEAKPEAIDRKVSKLSDGELRAAKRKNDQVRGLRDFFNLDNLADKGGAPYFYLAVEKETAKRAKSPKKSDSASGDKKDAIKKAKTESERERSQSQMIFAALAGVAVWALL